MLMFHVRFKTQEVPHLGGEVSSGRKNKENIVFKDGIGVKG